MKIRKVLLIIILITLVISGCTYNADQDEAADKKPVKIIEVTEEESVDELMYIGTVTPKEIKKLSFKSPGEIKSINVEEGQKVKKGQTLAVIDTKDISYGIQASKAAKDAAKAQYDKAVNGATEEDISLAETNVIKAEKAYEYARENFQRIEKLYEAGGLSKQDIDGAKLELDIRQEEYNAAKTLLEQAKKGSREEDIEFLKAQISQADSDLNYKQSMVNDSVMKSDMDGYVMGLLAKSGEITGSGYPVIIVGSSINIVKFGLTPEDIADVNIGDGIRVEVQGETYGGKITGIEKIMVEETRTYTVKGEIEDGSLPSGTVAKVYIPKGKYNAINIPLTSIMRGNYDYVYVVVGEEVKKKQIQLGVVRGDRVEVTGLAKGDKLVIEGMKKLNDGDLVEVIN